MVVIRLYKCTISKWTFYSVFSKVSTKRKSSFAMALSHLKESFNSKEIPYDSDMTCSAEEIKISFTRLQLKEFENDFLGTYVKEPLVNQETIMKNILNEFENQSASRNTMLNYYCSYYCPLCKAQCFKKNNHKARHDCFHILGGVVGHYH